MFAEINACHTEMMNREKTNKNLRDEQGKRFAVKHTKFMFFPWRFFDSVNKNKLLGDTAFFTRQLRVY